jgi:hypothetical protein
MPAFEPVHVVRIAAEANMALIRHEANIQRQADNQRNMEA